MGDSFLNIKSIYTLKERYLSSGIWIQMLFCLLSSLSHKMIKLFVIFYAFLYFRIATKFVSKNKFKKLKEINDLLGASGKLLFYYFIHLSTLLETLYKFFNDLSCCLILNSF